MKKIAVSALVSSMAASLIGLGLWFAPTHGQTNAETAQLIDVTVVDDQRDPVVGAPITVQHYNGTSWVGARGGRASDAAGESSIQMPTAKGSYRIVLTVPQGYTEWYDDADRGNAGRNFECAGMVRRCVAYDIDAAGNVTLNQPHQGANGMAFTFYVKENKTQPRISVTQKDAAGNPISGGTVTMQPFAIVEVNGQKVRQWGRVSRTGMTTAARTFNVQRNTSYVVRWEPPKGWFRLVPTAPGFSYEVTTGARGTSALPFIVHQPTAQNDSGGQLDSGGNEITPPGASEQPSGKGEAPEQRKAEPQPQAPADPDPQDQQSSTGSSTPVEPVPAGTVPTETVSTETVPAETVPTETVPTETVSTETVPAETVPTETVPTETVPAETVPTETVPEGTVAVDEEAQAAVELEQELVDSAD